MIQPYLHKLQKITWYILIALLPLTSMPLVKKLLGSDSVASPAIIFLVILIFLWLAGLIFNDRLLISSKVLPLALFTCVAIIATLFSFFLQTPAFKGFGELKPIISVIATLVIGFLFFLIASSFPVDDEVKNKTLKVINWTGLIILIWCAFQALAWYGTQHYPQWMFKIQGFLSERVLYRQRTTGFALEPSWLAHQLNMLYLPFWLSATLTGYSSHSFRIKRISFENILLAGGVLTLGLTLSRVGFAAFLCMSALAIVLIHRHIVSAINTWLTDKLKPRIKLNRKSISHIIIVLYILLVALLVLVYSRIDPRMASLFKFSFDQDSPLLRYFNQLKFGDRVVYWLTGWNIFNEHPIIGVGLGNAGFYFPQNIPAYGWSLLEVRRLLYRSHLLLNVKSLWFRLLAETGIVGFSLFIGWIISLLSRLVEKYKSAKPIERTLGLAGILVVLGLIFEGLSIDSFAMPYWWISLGLAVTSYKK
ncbi:MAG: O-antigen ligase family protein [Pelolinea sp.]|nr:O-antigen ligase family protein [Pelolinea sp.]